jgi:hypothetical protein
MSAVEFGKVSTTSHKRIPVLRLTRQYTRKYMDWIRPIIKLKLCEILNGFMRNIIQSGIMDRWGSQYVSLSAQILTYIKWFVFVNRYIAQVVPWRCLSSSLHCTYTLSGELRNSQYCSSLLHYRRINYDVVPCRAQEVEN